MSEETDGARTLSRPIDIITSPFARFARMEAASGILLLASTIAALIWANSQWDQSYATLWHTQAALGFDRFSLSESRHEWINDGLMSVFFFLVGLEIKREVLIGELSSLRQAAFPFIAAIGGTAVPTLIYTLVAYGSGARNGWGIPMATDIAFALGVLALLGNRIPMSLKIFVTALAIVDDIFAVLVIAVFYTARIHFLALGVGLALVAVSFGANLMGVRKPAVYGALGVCVWFAVLRSGVHATVAGVLLAFTIPARTYLDRSLFLDRCRKLLNRFEAAVPNSYEANAVVHTLETQCELVESPLHRIEHALQPWVSFLVMPLFAFSNAGVRILGNAAAAVRHPVSVGVALGLFCGKPLGIWLFARLSVAARLATQPLGVSWMEIFGASWVCGIGFTMSLFIAGLAFGEGPLLAMSKIGILAASLMAGICGSIFLLRRGQEDFAAEGPSRL